MECGGTFLIQEKKNSDFIRTGAVLMTDWEEETAIPSVFCLEGWK